MGSGSRQWWGGADRGGPVMVDLDRLEVVDRSPDENFPYIHAVAADGTVFLSNAAAGGVVAVYRPGAPDDRQVLAGRQVRLTSHEACCVGSDGRVWADLHGQGLRCFDGKAWQRVAGLAAGTHASLVIPGCSGAVFAQADGGRFVLIAGGKAHEGDSLERFVAEHRVEFTAAFGGRYCLDWWARGAGLAVDKGGNIWLLWQRRLRVLAGDSWVDPVFRGENGEDLGGRGDTQFLAPVGDGGRVYLHETDWFDGWVFFGQVTGGKAVCVRTINARPRIGSLARNKVIRDNEGGLWLVNNSIASGARGSDRQRIVRRATEKGFVEEYGVIGWPCVADESGVVWAAHDDGAKTGEVSLVSGGRIAARLTLPGMEGVCSMFSDRPGSVYVWTYRGMRHYVAKDPAEPARYSVEQTYYPQGPGGAVLRAHMANRVAASRLGYAVIVTTSDYACGGREVWPWLNLVPLPGGPAGK